MNIFKRVRINIAKQPIKNAILCVLIFILGAVLSGAISIRNAIIITEENLMVRMPAISTLVFDSNAALATGLPEFQERIMPLTVEEMTAVGNLPYVRAYDFFLNPIFFSRNLLWAEMEVDEERVPASELGMIQWMVHSARSRGAEIETFQGRGVSRADITDIDTGLITLVDGRTFTQSEIDSSAMVVVISQAFATINHLTIGSVIEFENIAYDYMMMGREGTGIFELDRHNEQFMLAQRVLEFEVIGIFDIAHELIYEAYEGLMLADVIVQRAGLYNRIYMPVGVAGDMMNFVITSMDDEQIALAMPSDESWLESLFVLYNPRDLITFSEAAQAILPEFWRTADVSVAFAGVMSSMDSMLQIADFVQWVVIVASIVVLTLVIALFLRDRRHEIGVYMALGEEKRRVITQILIEIGLVSIIAITLALFAGNFLSDILSRQMLEQQLTQQLEEDEIRGVISWELVLFDPGAMTAEETMKMYDVSLDVNTILTFVGVGTVVILVSTIFPIWYVVKLEPKEILL